MQPIYSVDVVCLFFFMTWYSISTLVDCVHIGQQEV